MSVDTITLEQLWSEVSFSPNESQRKAIEHVDGPLYFPKRRIPFLTVHQSKGLEFPVVVLGNLRKDDREPQRTEEIVNPLLDRKGEPLHRMSEFDTMRMFYVALSRAKNLLVLAHFKGPGQRINPPFQSLIGNGSVVRCDARYSCDSFRVYHAQRRRRVADATMTYLADTASDIELTARPVAGLDVAPELATLE